MTNITTRAGVGRPLTYAEMDGNFNKLNSGKAEQGAVDALSQKVTQTANTANSAMQGVNQLESPSGASLVGIGTDNVGSVLNALQLTNYAALRAYTGARQNVFLTGYSVAAVPLGIAGMFIRDDYDKSTIDNNATVIVSTDGTRWKRAITGPINVQWFGAMGN